MKPSSRLVPFLICGCVFSLQCRSGTNPSTIRPRPGPDLDLKWERLHSAPELSFRGLALTPTGSVWVGGSRGTVLRGTGDSPTWSRRSPANSAELDFRDVEAIDDQRIYALSAGAGALSRIYSTTDAGNSWRLQHQNPPQQGFLDGLDFWSAANGVAFGDPLKDKLQLMVTADSGRTWSSAASKLFPNALEGEHAYAASGSSITTWGPNHVWIGTGGSISRVYASADRGKTWRSSSSPLGNGSSSAGIFSMAFRSAEIGVAVGGDYQDPDGVIGTAAFTDNGGRTWQSADSADGLPGYRSTVVFVAHSKGAIWLASGPNGTDYSLDDGKSWKRLSREGFHVLATHPEVPYVWAAGSEGRIARLSLQHLQDSLLGFK